MKKFAVALVASIVVATPAFAGARIELHSGYDRSSAEGEHAANVMYGVGAGYDLPIGARSFVGVDANYEDSSTEYCDALSAATVACLNANRDWSVGGRFGYNVGQHGKAYVLGAYTNAKVTASVTSGTSTIEASDKLDGFRVGVGYQQGSDIGAYFKVEYRYSNYQQDFSRNQVLAGVGWEF